MSRRCSKLSVFLCPGCTFWVASCWWKRCTNNLAQMWSSAVRGLHRTTWFWATALFNCVWQQWRLLSRRILRSYDQSTDDGTRSGIICHLQLFSGMRSYDSLPPIFLSFSCGSVAQCGPWLPQSWGFWISHNDAPHSIWLLWMSDQLVAETSTWQHTTLTTDKYLCHRWGSNPQPQQASGRRTTHSATGTGECLYNLNILSLSLLPAEKSLELEEDRLTPVQVTKSLLQYKRKWYQLWGTICCAKPRLADTAYLLS